MAINSEEDLKKIGQNMDGDFVLNDDITLTSDWTPLGMDGDSTKPFTEPSMARAIRFLV